MNKAEELLFDQLFGGKPLFLTQQELVNQLLSDEQSAYHTAKDSSDYPIKLNRLKSYISQLLSENVSRSVSPIFRQALRRIIEKRLAGSEYDAKDISEKILQSFVEKNKPHAIKKAFISTFNPKQQLIDDIAAASYILVITARPFDINDNDSRFSIQQFLIQDLIQSLVNPEKPMKYYRFNFPLRTLCDLFWMALRKRLEKGLFQYLSSKEFVQVLHKRSIIPSSIFDSLIVKKETSDQDIKIVVNELLNYLINNKYLLVFLIDEPIFSAPMIVLNPNDSKNWSGYIILENESKYTHVSRLPIQDILTWKLFVFDIIKTRGLGKQIDYKTSVQNN